MNDSLTHKDSYMLPPTGVETCRKCNRKIPTTNAQTVGIFLLIKTSWMVKQTIQNVSVLNAYKRQLCFSSVHKFAEPQHFFILSSAYFFADKK